MHQDRLRPGSVDQSRQADVACFVHAAVAIGHDQRVARGHRVGLAAVTDTLVDLHACRGTLGLQDGATQGHGTGGRTMLVGAVRMALTGRRATVEPDRVRLAAHGRERDETMLGGRAVVVR